MARSGFDDMKQSSPANIPVVSVLVLTYNHERFIAKCLDNILMQKIAFPVEVIVHDDASTDGTPGIIRSYAEKYPDIIKPVLQSENQMSKGKKFRETFHNMAQGEFIAGCDGDDFWTDQHKLAKQVAFLKKNHSYVLSFHDALHFDDETKEITRRSNLPVESRRDYTKDELRIMKWSNYLLFGTVLYRNVLDDFPPELHLVPNGDNFLPMLLAAHGGARYQPEIGPLARREHNNSAYFSKSIIDQTGMHLRSYLLIAAYFLRIGEIETALHMMKGRMIRTLSSFIDLTGRTGSN